MAAPWMASEDSLCRKVETFQNTVLSECFESILRACRGESACGRGERRDAHLIETDQDNEREDKDFPDDGKGFIRWLFHFLPVWAGFRSVGL